MHFSAIILLAALTAQGISSCSTSVRKTRDSLSHSEEHHEIEGEMPIFYNGRNNQAIKSIGGKPFYHSTPLRHQDQGGIAQETKGIYSYAYHPYSYGYHNHIPYRSFPVATDRHYFFRNYNYPYRHNPNYQNRFHYYVPSVYSSSVSMNSRHGGGSISAIRYNNNGKIGGAYYFSGNYPHK